MKKIYAAVFTIVAMIAFSSNSFSQATTRSLTWNLAGAQNWPTVGAGNTWDNRNNWVITGAGTVPATNVTNGDKLIIPNTTGVVINITADLPISFNNFVIEVQGVGLVNLQSGVDLTLTGPATAFSLASVTAAHGLTLQKAAGSNNTQLIINSITKAINTANNSALQLTASSTSLQALGSNAQSAAATGFGGFLLGALPVVLNNFNTVLVPGQKVALSWTTQQEVNAAYFDLQKSNDGINWQTFATVKASGNSSAPLAYSAVDIAPAKGANYYRIASVDLDGKTAYTAVRNVRVNEGGKVNIYPNPASTTLMVSLGTAASSDWSISIVNINGQVVLQKKFSSITSSVNLAVSNLPNGNYTLEIAEGSAKLSKKLLITHQ